MSHDDLVAARVTCTFGGHEYTARRLHDKDIYELNEWCRGRYISMARQSLEGVEDPELRTETIKIALSEAAELFAFVGTGAKMMSKPEGLARIIYQAVKDSHPEAEYEEFHKAVLTPEGIEEAQLLLERIKPKTPDSPGGGHSGNLRNGKSKRRKKKSTKS